MKYMGSPPSDSIPTNLPCLISGKGLVSNSITAISELVTDTLRANI